MSAAVGMLLATQRGGIHSEGRRQNKVLAYAKLQESRTCIWGEGAMRSRRRRNKQICYCGY
jgi:hypothetical protein